ncbi:MAG: DUF455 family protein, partial [Myxococcota bacterium]
MLEEQSHLRRYQARMHDLGVELGDVPVSDFFWSTMASMNSPLDFVVRMSMTFEQANLDHSLHYAHLFRQVEDTETAELMDVVYREEIGHVKHGVHWFNQWRHANAPDGEKNDWQAYNRLLPAPLSARRARGQAYLFDVRRQVGLSETFARELEVFSHSRGRPPVVWLFEPDFEAQQMPHPPPTSAASRRIADDLAAVLMFEAGSDDIVITPNRPRRALLTALTRAGFAVPQLVTSPVHEVARALQGRTISGVEGWGETAAVRTLRSANALESRATFDPSVTSKAWASRLRADFRERHPGWSHLLGPRVTEGQICSTLDDVIRTQHHCAKAGFTEVVVKRPFSTSGQARRRFSVQAPLHDDRWLAKTLAGEHVLVEPWLDGVADFSVLLDVTDADA